ncbi:unnamed protein product [Litomosoides sigmodontis]|uniref:Uncharacterized protein n=1 Tax=Litomosoides sigmodontis TaxID=42156 RepID=A0A3P6SWC0_LITSI|nr:unnamed protein product [Litomosoides sigmodontis]
MPVLKHREEQTFDLEEEITELRKALKRKERKKEYRRVRKDCSRLSQKIAKEIIFIKWGHLQQLVIKRDDEEECCLIISSKGKKKQLMEELLNSSSIGNHLAIRARRRCYVKKPYQTSVSWTDDG